METFSIPRYRPFEHVPVLVHPGQTPWDTTTQYPPTQAYRGQVTRITWSPLPEPGFRQGMEYYVIPGSATLGIGGEELALRIVHAASPR